MITRYRALKEFVKCLHPTDVGVFVGNTLCQEAYKNDREGNFYILDSCSPALSFSLGLSITSKKRIFLFTSDSTFLRDISAVAQMAVSRCKNLIYVILATGTYSEIGKHPNIFNSLSHPQGILFRMGFTSFVFDNYYDNQVSIKEMKSIIDSLVGPVSILINVSTKVITKKEIDKPTTFFVNRLHAFIKDDDTALFEPPPLMNLEI